MSMDNSPSNLETLEYLGLFTHKISLIVFSMKLYMVYTTYSVAGLNYKYAHFLINCVCLLYSILILKWLTLWSVLK